jgi:hypothetical protein
MQLSSRRRWRQQRWIIPLSSGTSSQALVALAVILIAEWWRLTKLALGPMTTWAPVYIYSGRQKYNPLRYQLS